MYNVAVGKGNYVEVRSQFTKEKTKKDQVRHLGVTTFNNIRLSSATAHNGELRPSYITFNKVLNIIYD